MTDANGHATTYCYDPTTLEVKQVTDANGHTRSTSYTPNYDVAQLTDPLTNTTIFTYSTDGKNNLNSVTDGNGAKTAFGYGDSGHPYYPTSQSDPQANNYSYTYDTADNLTNSVNSLPTQDRLTYTYNSGNELTQSVSNSNTTTYSYDGDGNLTGATPGVYRLVYNAKNQTTSYQQAFDQQPITSTYAGADQTERTQAQYTNATQTQTYTLTFENTALGVSAQTSSCSPSCGTTTTTYYTRDSRGALISQRFSPGGASATQYYLFDGNGSVVGLTDTSGTLVATYSYDPYGNVVSQTGSASSPWQFQSGYRDSGGYTTGYVKFGARYDDPTLGRWTQQDPVGGSLGDTGAVNRYVCVRDDPVNVSDALSLRRRGRRARGGGRSARREGR